tara:strand:+ start:124 stop:591 length:468 start_codon:yes stop_codon:yes gene_type:complete
MKKQTEYMRKYRKTEKGHKACVICNWKHMGLIDDYDKVYDRFMKTTHCDKCNCLLTNYKKGGCEKQMDHCHRTNKFRNVLCGRCNYSDTTRMMNKNQKYGHKGLTFVKSKNLWSYRKENQQLNFKFKKMSKSKTNILCIKFACLILLNHKLLLKT